MRISGYAYDHVDNGGTLGLLAARVVPTTPTTSRA